MLYTYEDLCKRSAEAAKYDNYNFTSDGCVKCQVNGVEKMLLSCTPALAPEILLSMPSDPTVFFGASTDRDQIIEYSCNSNHICTQIRTLSFSD